MDTVVDSGRRTFSVFTTYNKEITTLARFTANWAPSPQVHNYHAIKCGFETPFQFHEYPQKSVFAVQREVPSIQQRNGGGKKAVSWWFSNNPLLLLSYSEVACPFNSSFCHFPFICSCEIALLRYDYRFAATVAQNTVQSKYTLPLLLHLLVNIQLFYFFSTAHSPHEKRACKNCHRFSVEDIVIPATANKSGGWSWSASSSAAAAPAGAELMEEGHQYEGRDGMH